MKKNSIGEKKDLDKSLYEYIEKDINLNRYIKLKRVFDIICSLVLLIITSPILLGSLIIVYLQDFKNPIFSQVRVGANNKEYILYKIRSMVHNAEQYGIKWASKDDARITLFGKFIRRFRIDELPQLINVIQGNMSIIGPRPELEFFYHEFEKTIPNYRDRLMVKPGITGWAQVSGGYNLMPEEKLALDLYYIRNIGYTMDMKIILKTIIVIFTGNGAR